MHEALGFMAALISMPTMLRPRTWIEAILGEAHFESAADAQSLVNTLMLAYNDIATRLQKGGRVGPSTDADDVVEAWCRGYADGAALDDAWMNDELGTLMLIPFETFARGIDPRDAVELHDETVDVVKARWKRELPARVRQIHEYWADARREQAEALAGSSGTDVVTRNGAPEDDRARAVGRKQPCPCGSGKKFKHCCGAQ